MNRVKRLKRKNFEVKAISDIVEQRDLCLGIYSSVVVVVSFFVVSSAVGDSSGRSSCGCSSVRRELVWWWGSSDLRGFVVFSNRNKGFSMSCSAGFTEETDEKEGEGFISHGARCRCESEVCLSVSGMRLSSC